ncbi:MAG: enoyl-CoA hydratase-related protein [Sphingorhabdus sp.]
MTLRLERSGPVGTIIINRPEKRNAFNQEMWDRFPVLLTHAMADRAIRVIVIRSSTNGMFCAGADIAELLAHKANPAWREANQAAIYKTQHELARAGKPTIAFIDGDCVGGGCGIALACDIRVATARARIGITPAKLGLVYPLHDIKLLIDLVGPGQAKKMLFSGELYSAVEALRINLIEEINGDVEMLALQIASNSSHSIHEMKILVRNILDGQVEEDASSKKRFADALTKPDFLEGCAAFVDRRKPDFI